jgi:hypothetical protein
MPENKRYFTIQTIKGSGLGDQLGTQFSRLYGLGKALGASYLYTPVSFHRSIKPRWYELSQSILFKLRYILFFSIGQNLFSSAVNGLFLQIEKRLDANLKKHVDNELSDFLGLKYISEGNKIELENPSFCDIYMDDFFESTQLFQFNDFLVYVTALMKDKMNSTILRFNWTGKMWALIPKIDQLLKEAGLDKDIILQNTFSSGFWKQHIQPFSDKTNIVFHIRCGDSTTVQLGKRELIVYDKFLYESVDEMIEIFKIDPDRISVLPEEYNQVYDQIVSKVGLEKITLTVISDGYELTYRNLLRNLLKRKCAIRLKSNEKKILAQKIKEFNLVFKIFTHAKLIIGESDQNLQDSIYTLANADVVIWGCGGFACNTHFLFKGIDKKSLVINVKDFSESKINLINELKNG